MQIIVITPDDMVDDEIKIVHQLFAMGLQKLHLRKPHFTLEDHKHYINSINRQYHRNIILANYYELYEPFSSGGIHLSSATRNDAAVWRQVKELRPASISTSFHSWQEVAANEYPYNYVFISPVFNSISKKEYKAGIDLQGAAVTRRDLAEKRKHCPAIIGLGGVDAKQIIELNRNGFDGAALLGAIWTAEKPVNVFEEVLAAVRIIEDA